ncbi:uncharacterized protein LOC122066413 [Macadamia integrifolia]|uniref:uncharacterized protein LOC122066413 n=1 Tax=Macadamia integrifolia TaxID=60698 RepID=UPI001C4E8082|nr:uncharacterized protein LOC122066413 [Macadamia integrifolia]
MFRVSSNMKASNRLSLPADTRSRRSCFCTFLPTVSLLCLVFFIGSVFVVTDHTERFARWGMVDNVLMAETITCENQCRPEGSEALPKGIVSRTSNLDMQQLWGLPPKKRVRENTQSSPFFFRYNTQNSLDGW